MVRNVLCVDDNQDNNEVLKVMFEQEDFRVTLCSTADECLESLKNNDFSALVLDNRMPEKSGTNICREIRELHPQMPIVFFSADARKRTAQAAIKAGADVFLVKPNDIGNVVPTVIRLIETKHE